MLSASSTSGCMGNDLSHFLVWYALSSAAGLVGLPVTYKLFQALPGRGIAFARPLGLLLVGYIFWLLGSLGILNNDPASLVFAALLVLAGGTAWLKKKGFVSLMGWLRKEWRGLLAIEILFLLSFAGWALIRAYNPEILGTEKPMEFMFLNSILRSPTLPPQDAWLSGHAISYYYFGYLISASLARLGATPAAVAFNLSLALWFALAVVGAAGIGMELIAIFRRQFTGHSGQAAVSVRRNFLPALLAPLLLLVTANLYGALGLVHENRLFTNLRVPAVYYDFGVQSEGSFERNPGVRAGLLNVWTWLDLKGLPADQPQPSPGFRFDLGNWFYASRVVHDRDLSGKEVEAIDEMPAFSFLLGDLHPHLLALPFVLLMVMVSLMWMLDIRACLLPWRRTLAWGLPRIIISSILLGSLLALNTWDFPIYAFLLGVGMFLGAGLRLGWSSSMKWMPRLTTVWLIVVGLSFVLYLPFFLTFQSQAGGVLPNVFYPTRFQQLLVMFIPLLAAVFIYLVWCLRQGKDFFDRKTAFWVGAGSLLLLSAATVLLTWIALQMEAAQPYIQQFLAPFSLNQGVVLAIQRRLVDGFSALLLSCLVGVTAGLLAGALKAVKRGMGKHLMVQPAVLFSLAMVAIAALLVLIPEYLYLRDNFGTRMNTLFKFYFQAWVLWSLSGAFGLWLVFHFGSRRARWISGIIAALPILLGLVYLPAALWSNTDGFSKSLSLDGMAYFANQYPNDWAAILWLQENVPDKTIILEGSRGAYWVEGRSGRISMATGLPTVLGWANHERQWRGVYFSQVAGREADIQAIYTSKDWEKTRQLLQSFGVEYVVLSDLERDWYRPVNETGFERYLTPVFRSGDLTIYQFRLPTAVPLR
jgi:YYY domain-containing protein